MAKSRRRRVKLIPSSVRAAPNTERIPTLKIPDIPDTAQETAKFLHLTQQDCTEKV